MQVDIHIYDIEDKEPIFSGHAAIGKEVIEISDLLPGTQYKIDANTTKDVNTTVFTGIFCIISKDDVLSIEYQLTEQAYKIAACSDATVDQLQAAAEIIATNQDVALFSADDGNDQLYEMAAAVLSSAEVAGIRYERESNNSRSTANLVFNDDTTYGKISSSSDVDYYKVKFDTAGYANFWLGDIPRGIDYDLYLYNSSGTLLSCSKGTSSQEQIYKYPVSANSWYYLKVIGYNGSFSQSMRYRLRAKNYPASEARDMYEVNNSPTTATSIANNATITAANIHTTSDVDYFTFTLTEMSDVNISLTNIPSGCDYELAFYNNAGSLVARSVNGGSKSESISVRVALGAYYIKVYSYNGCAAANYRLTISSKSAYTPDNYEPNNSFSTATAITIPNAYFANLHSMNDYDYYVFTLPELSSVNINLKNIPAGCDYELLLFDSSRRLISSSKNSYNTDESILTILNAGTYYIKVYSYNNVASTNYKLEVFSDGPVVYGNFSRAVQTPAIPPDVMESLSEINKEYDVWPAGIISIYYGLPFEVRADALRTILQTAWLTITGGSLTSYDMAADYLEHFLDNDGKQKTILVNDLILEDSTARTDRNDYFNQALEAAEYLAQEGEFVTFCSLKSHLTTPSTTDWYYSLGTCSAQIKCKVRKYGDRYTANITYYVYDVYDWERDDTNMGNLPVSQRDMWELQYGGLAMSYYSTGSYTYSVTWTRGQRIGSGASISG